MDKSQQHIIFNEMVRQYKCFIVKICLVFCNQDPEKMKDMQQDILSALWESLSRYNGKCKPSTWAYRIVLNAAISHKRHQSTIPTFVPLSDILLQELVAEQNDNDMNELYRLIDKLSPNEKTLILLYLDNKTIAEIGEILGYSVSAVNHRIALIKDKLIKLHNNEQ